MSITGNKDLDLQLILIAGEGTKSINGVLRKASRESAKKILIPAARTYLREHDRGSKARRKYGKGLIRSLKVRAIRRSKSRVGVSVGFPDPLFKGDTFYGGFLEFGTDRRSTKMGHDRGIMPKDSFLRRPLYNNEDGIRMAFQTAIRKLISEANSRVPNVT